MCMYWFVHLEEASEVTLAESAESADNECDC